ncbi:hypothetical protein TNCV_2994041 [Trichonephila clavipes]|nr:hypothetical protein TNCV_2994041 [Trichonephila clavipes]
MSSAFVVSLNSRRVSSEVGGRGREVGNPGRSGSSQNWSGTELNRTVTCMVLKAMANDRHKSLSAMNFVGPNLTPLYMGH